MIVSKVHAHRPAGGSDFTLDEDTCRLVCPISAAMVGVCLTAIGLLRIISTVDGVNSWADDLLSLDAVTFLVATLSSYTALRTRSARRLHRLERVADASFLASMVLLTASCLVLTYFLSAS